MGVGLTALEADPGAGQVVFYQLRNTDADNVVLLPHLGSATEAARRRMAETALTDALAVFEGRAPRFVVPELRPAGASP